MDFVVSLYHYTPRHGKKNLLPKPCVGTRRIIASRPRCVIDLSLTKRKFFMNSPSLRKRRRRGSPRLLRCLLYWQPQEHLGDVPPQPPANMMSMSRIIQSPLLQLFEQNILCQPPKKLFGELRPHAVSGAGAFSCRTGSVT